MPQQIVTDLLIKSIDTKHNHQLNPIHVINSKDIITGPRFLLNGNINLKHDNLNFITSLANNSSTYIQIHSNDFFYIQMSFDSSLNTRDANTDISTFTIKTKTFSYSNYLMPLYILIANGTNDLDPNTNQLVQSSAATDVDIEYLLAGHNNSNFQDQTYIPVNSISGGMF